MEKKDNVVFREADLIEVELRAPGPKAHVDLGDVACVLCWDLDPGCASWHARALLQRSRLGELLEQTGYLVYAIRTWAGEAFGDGNGGTVELQADTGLVAGDGLDEAAYARVQS